MQGYFPADPLPVALFLQFLIESTNSHSSVDAPFYAIKWAHESAGLKSPTDNALAGRVREGAKRILGTERANRKEPLPLGVLKAIVDGSDLSDCLVLRNVCLFLLCFTGFLRFADVSRIRRNQISFHEGFMKIKIGKSKNDQLREGNDVLVSEAEGSVCPVKILNEYLLRMNISPSSTELIFEQLIKTKASHKLAAGDKPIC